MTLTMAMVTIAWAAYSSAAWLWSGNGKIMRIQDTLEHGLQWKKC
jgi:hypothetical protein